MRLILIALLCLTTTSLNAKDDPHMRQLGEKLRFCMTLHATFYASKSCHAPSELMPAIISQCRADRTEVVDYLSKQTSNDVVEETMKRVDEQIKQDTAASIVDAQIKRECP